MPVRPQHVSATCDHARIAFVRRAFLDFALWASSTTSVIGRPDRAQGEGARAAGQPSQVVRVTPADGGWETIASGALMNRVDAEPVTAGGGPVGQDGQRRDDDERGVLPVAPPREQGLCGLAEALLIRKDSASPVGEVATRRRPPETQRWKGDRWLPLSPRAQRIL